jgi:putative mycofactocin binding protein MftB
MVSAVSTEPGMNTESDRPEDAHYTISPHVRVRKEAFGLLFFDTEHSRLTFVKSGNLLQIKALPNGAKSIAAARDPQTQARMRKLLNHLKKKRLIRGS